MGDPPPPTQDFAHASTAMQNQLHEISLAFPMPQPRKQNTACDACRTRKVKCHQVPGQDKCQHCITKNYPCTHHAQQQTEKKRQANARRASRGTPADTSLQTLSLPSPSRSDTLKHSPQPPLSPQSPMSQFLAYLFSPAPEAQPPSFVGGYGYPNRHSAAAKSGVADWGEVGTKLQDESFRIEFALDLIEVYFQICHTRLPILNPTQFRARFRLSLPNSSATQSLPHASLKPLPFALLAVVLAWGAKFSEHPLLVLDRLQSPSPPPLTTTQHISAPVGPNPIAGGRSRVAKALVDRAREVAEGERIYRVANPDNVILALLLEPLQSQSTADPDGFHGFWLSSAVRHLLEMQINYKSPILTGPPAFGTSGEPDEKGSMVFCWWMACLADALSSAYFRRKPMLEDSDYNIQDFPTSPPASSQNSNGQDQMPSRRTHNDFITWYGSLHALAVAVRTMSRALWKPATEVEGIPFALLQSLVETFSKWRDEHLPCVGVPSNFEAEWDFVAAVSACSSDATYHVMWIIISQAVEDFGIKEINEVLRSGANPNDAALASSELDGMEALRNKVAEEALHSALRIAGLTGVLTSNGYLRLDPNVIHYSTYAAGLLLAHMARPEVVNCIAGLKQYGYAYEEAWDQCIELERTYANACAEQQQQQQQQQPMDTTPYPSSAQPQQNVNGVPPLQVSEQPTSSYPVYDQTNPNVQQPQSPDGNPSSYSQMYYPQQ